MKTSNRPFVPPVYASRKAHDYYAPICYDMLLSENYKKLTGAQKAFYITCRVHAASDKGKRNIHKYNEKEGTNYRTNLDDKTELYFVFPASHMKEYGIEPSNGSKMMKVLIEKGFVDVVENNRHRHKINIYKFSERWKG